MMKNKNARPTAATVGQANGNAVSNFQTHFTPEEDFGQFLISDFLNVGQCNAVNLKYLRSITGMKGREIRRMIRAERLKGIPILADNQTGYFLPATEEERNRCVQSMKHRAKEIYKAAHAIEAADIQIPRHPVNGLEKQSAVDGWFDGR